MAGGSAALAGMVFVPVVAAIGFSSHWKANEIDDRAAELEVANRKNQGALASQKRYLTDVQGLAPRIERESTALSEAVQRAKRALFRFRFLSELYKNIRYAIKGNYYSSAEMEHVDALAAAVDQFIVAVGGANWQESNHK